MRQRRLLFWTAVASVLLASLLACTPVRPPQPPTPPSPTPPPPSVLPTLSASGGKFMAGGQEVKLVGASVCCDNPDTSVDEGFRDGWSLAFPEPLDKLKAGSRNIVHMRSGPYASLDPVFPGEKEGQILPHLRKSVQDANQRGMYVEVDLVDNWTLASGGGAYGDDCHVTQGPPPARYLAWVDAVVSSTGDLAVIYNLGNEAFRCKPRTEWETGLIDQVRQTEAARHWPRHLVGASWWMPDVRPDPKPDYVELQDVFYPPDPYCGPNGCLPVILNEDDGGYHNPEQWKAIRSQADAKGTSVWWWRGIQSDAEWAFLLGIGPDPGPRCGGAPATHQFQITARYQASLIVDATPKVCDAVYCENHGAPGQGCCAYGGETPEEWTQRGICESEHGQPFAWSFNGVPCKAYAQEGTSCWLNGNPLQIIVEPITAVGTVTVCAKGGAGACSSINVSP